MSKDPAALLSVLGGTPRGNSPQGATPVIGTIRSVAADGVRFVVPSYDAGRHVFGPAPWNRAAAGPATVPSGGDPGHAHGDHTHPPLPPSEGASCLVIFVGAGIGSPVVVAWW